jgi:predicted dehydrogenase
MSRRDFLGKSAIVTAGAAAMASLGDSPRVHAAGSDLIKVALVGCGGRGTGAATQALNTGANVKLVAVADAFRDRAEGSLRAIAGACKDRVNVPAEQVFTGLDAYRQAIDCGADVVLLCTPPGFRPTHFAAAVEAGKHVFLEKPLAVDAPGVRTVMAANEAAKKKGLKVAVGLHLRHASYNREAVKRVHQKALGAIHTLRAYTNIGGLGERPRRPGETEMEYQVRNWYFFLWTCGDHVVEQNIHSLDVINWLAQSHPVQAQGMGGRQVRVGRDFGEIFDHHAVEFDYPGGVKLFNFARQISNTYSAFSQHALGTLGQADLFGYGNKAVIATKGRPPVQFANIGNPYQLEHDRFFHAIACGEPYNEADYGATSTMTAILGRMASYSGQVVTWDQALHSTLSVMPTRLAWDAAPPTKPAADGLYPCALPGVTKAW